MTKRREPSWALRSTAGFRAVALLACLLAVAFTGGRADAQCSNPCAGDLNDDGLVDELDVVAWYVASERVIFDPCADLDGNLVIDDADLVLLKASFGACFPAACPNPGHACDQIGTAGCDDATCCGLVCGLEPFCCDVSWDAACVITAEKICDPSAGQCMLPHGGVGCRSTPCSDAVCAVDPTCCSVAWDLDCVRIAGDLCTALVCPSCDSCDNPFAGTCTTSNIGAGCANGECCALVCQADPFCCETRWDVVCAKAASDVCVTEVGFCGRDDQESCYTLHDGPGCGDFECCDAVCAVDSYCCAAEWDAICATLAFEVCTIFDECGLGAGSCIVPNGTPGCDDVGCCDQVCRNDPTCCDVEWDEQCVRIASRECSGCGDRLSGSCFEARGFPNCNDRECCANVCVIDPSCCDAAWDFICVNTARNLCFNPVDRCGIDGVTRSCFVASGAAGCDDQNCCREVCEVVDPYCCEVRWDAVCATQAFAFCNPPTPAIAARGSCLVANAQRGCQNVRCATAVCVIDPLCCDIEWTQSCADLAREICFDLTICPSEGSCSSAHSNAGCNDAFCCNAVCSIDPTCCDLAWDIGCAQLAILNCFTSRVDNCPCAGDCFSGNGSPGCEIGSCCAAVCQTPGFEFCCDVEWDEVCAEAASDICCSPTCGDPCAGSCIETSSRPFCDDPACCSAVCEIDPICCSVSWDFACVELAADRCLRGCGIETTGSCFVIKSTPGCNDEECCPTVCEADSFCCSTSWDSVCRDLALKVCADSVPDCGDFSAGDACEPNGSPAASDRRCCQAVCEQDPFCCDTLWDETCVQLARGLARNDGGGAGPCNACGFDCGDACAGDCCSANGTPSCNDEDCCDAVCKVDSFCCESEWDLTCAQIALATSDCRGPDDPCPSPECGDKDAGSCCFANGSASCDDASCCQQVCNEDPFCCDSDWDEACASLARNLCGTLCGGGLSCGDADAGSCFDPNGTPYCDDEDCCDLVCLLDSACCSVEWDQFCADQAEVFCAP